MKNLTGFVSYILCAGLLSGFALDAGSAEAVGFIKKIFGVCSKCEQKTKKVTVKVPIIVPNPNPPPATIVSGFTEIITEESYWEYSADPAGVTGFNVDFQFDTSLYNFLGFKQIPGIDLNPLVLNLSDISLGFIKSIAGTALSGPVTGDFASVILTPKTSSDMMGGKYFINTTGSNFINYVDEDGFSQVYNTPGSFDPCPVPGPLPLFGLGVAFGCARKLRRKVRSLK